MSDYISREAVNALIKAECSPKVAAYLIDAVATIPAADVRPRWIPVTERLPEENGRYLVRYKRDIGLDYIEVHDDEVRIMRFFVDDGWRYPFLCQPELRKAEHQTVTHWMELPILPAEDNENG